MQTAVPQLCAPLSNAVPRNIFVLKQNHPGAKEIFPQSLSRELSENWFSCQSHPKHITPGCGCGGADAHSCRSPAGLTPTATASTPVPFQQLRLFIFTLPQEHRIHT